MKPQVTPADRTERTAAQRLGTLAVAGNVRGHATGFGGLIKTSVNGSEPVTTVPEYKTGQYAFLGKGEHSTRNVTHETLHLLGLSDRYKDMDVMATDKDGNKYVKGTTSVSNPGFRDDIMGADGVKFSPAHTENYGNFILGEESSKGSQFVLDRFVDIDPDTGNLIGGEQPK